jgi:hypothetical protein
MPRKICFGTLRIPMPLVSSPKDRNRLGNHAASLTKLRILHARIRALWVDRRKIALEIEHDFRLFKARFAQEFASERLAERHCFGSEAVPFIRTANPTTGWGPSASDGDRVRGRGPWPNGIGAEASLLFAIHRAGTETANPDRQSVLSGASGTSLFRDETRTRTGARGA